MFEVLTSEASYLRSLRVLTNHFHESRDLEEAMIIRDRKTLFSNVLRVREVQNLVLHTDTAGQSGKSTTPPAQLKKSPCTSRLQSSTRSNQEKTYTTLM
ncbi:unnamed protein product [Arctogadus glacialis]